MSELVRKIAGDLLDYPVEIEIRPDLKTAETVTQVHYKVPNLRGKLNLLTELLKDEKVFNKVIIFSKTKVNASNTGKYLQRLYGDDSVLVIHGNKTQQTRINSMKRFREENISVLVTTDLAARGLDVPDVSHVINFDIPLIYEDYVHRIGRTGRAFKTGNSITFVSPADEYHLVQIEKMIGQKVPEKKVPRNIEIPETGYDETQAMLREIDTQKRKEDPNFKGAFHVKKEPAKKFPAKKDFKKDSKKDSKKDPKKFRSKRK